MTRDEKLSVARQLARLRVDVIEAGYPAASDGDWDAVHQIAREIATPAVRRFCGLARATERDVDRCWTRSSRRSTRASHLPRHVRCAHEAQTGDDALSGGRCCEGHGLRAFAHGAEVEFSMKTRRAPIRSFLYEVSGTALDAGATTLIRARHGRQRHARGYGDLVAGVRATYTVSSARRSPPIATMISGSPWQIHWRECAPEPRQAGMHHQWHRRARRQRALEEFGWRYTRDGHSSGFNHIETVSWPAPRALVSS